MRRKEDDAICVYQKRVTICLSCGTFSDRLGFDANSVNVPMVVLLRRNPRVDTNDLDIGKLREEPYRGSEIGRTFGNKQS